MNLLQDSGEQRTTTRPDENDIVRRATDFRSDSLSLQYSRDALYPSLPRRTAHKLKIPKHAPQSRPRTWPRRRRCSFDFDIYARPRYKRGCRRVSVNFLCSPVVYPWRTRHGGPAAAIRAPPCADGGRESGPAEPGWDDAEADAEVYAEDGCEKE